MTYKKTWLSCLLWGVFTCITGMLLADYTISLWMQEINTAIGADTVVLLVVVFALTAGCCFLLTKVYNKILCKYQKNKRAQMIAENLLVWGIFSAALFYRIYLCMQLSAGSIAKTFYYEQALVTSGQTSVDLIRNIGDLYTFCLSFALSFLGNKLIAGVWLQILLQMLSALLGFFAIRWFAGKLPAYAVLVLLAFSPVYIDQLFSMTPEVFSFFLFLLALLIIGSYVKKYSLGVYDVPDLIFLAIICGLIIGILTYLDIRFITLFILFVWGISGTKEKKTSLSKGMSVFLFILAFAAAGLALMGLFAFEAYSLECTIETSACARISAYLHLPVYMPYITETSVIECIILVFPAAFLIMSFWFQPKVQNAAPWMALMLLFGPPHMMIETPGYRIYTVFIWSVLAGIGLQQCFTPRLKAVHVEEPAEDEINTEPTEKKEIIKEAEEIEPAKPRFIENPLPLPKKHEKKSMDYPHEVDETKMEYDIEIAENDDFDV